MGHNWADRWWQALLAQLPVKQHWRLPHREDMCLPGAMLPRRKGQPVRAMHPRYEVHVWIVVWQ